MDPIPRGGEHHALPTNARRHGVARALVVGAAALVILLDIYVIAQYVPAPPQSAQTHSGLPAITRVTRYVATNGSDTAIGGLDAPLRTIQRAVELAGPGDTVVIRGGQFPGFDIGAQGTADAPVTLRAFAGEEPVIEGGPDRPDVIRVTSEARHVVIEGLTVRGSVASRGSGILITNVEDGPILVKGCRFYDHEGFGVNIFWSRNISIVGNDINRNGTGVHVVGEGDGVVIEDNDIHENDRMIRNTPRDVDAHDDYGAVGVDIARTTGPLLVQRNRIWGNRAASYDYRWDGSAFSVYGASGLTISDNVAWDNQNLLETGTDPGGACADNRFVRNLAYGATTSGRSQGIILRCGERMLIAHNTLVNIDDFALLVGYDSPRFSGSIEEAVIRANLFVLSGDGEVYLVLSDRPADLEIDGNLAWNQGNVVADVVGQGETTRMVELTAWTGYEANGIAMDPLFVDEATHDYHLAAGSPAINAAEVVPGVSDHYVGTGPDLGAFEEQ